MSDIIDKHPTWTLSEFAESTQDALYNARIYNDIRLYMCESRNFIICEKLMKTNSSLTQLKDIDIGGLS